MSTNDEIKETLFDAIERISRGVALAEIEANNQHIFEIIKERVKLSEEKTAFKIQHPTPTEKLLRGIKPGDTMFAYAYGTFGGGERPMVQIDVIDYKSGTADCTLREHTARFQAGAKLTLYIQQLGYGRKL